MSCPNDQKDKISTRRTYLLLQQALFDLLSENPFEKITLTQLCARSLIPRSTFYRYFEDKYDLLSYSLQTFFERTHLAQDVLYLTDMETAKAYLTRILLAMNENKPSFHKIYLVNKGGVFMDIIRDFLIQMLTEKVKKCEKQGYSLKISCSIFTFLLADFYISAAKCFFEMGDAVPVEELVKNICLFAEKDFFASAPQAPANTAQPPR